MHGSGHLADRDDAVARLDAACALIRDGSMTEAHAVLCVLAGPGAARLEGADRALLCWALLDCRLSSGDLGSALAMGRELEELLVEPGLAAGIGHFASGELASAMGDAELALGHYLAVDAETAADPVAPDLLPWRSGAALALVRLHRHREAGELARSHHEEAVASGSAYAVAQALRTLAATDPGERRIALLREAREVLAGLPHQRLLAQIDTDLAGLLALLPDGAGRDEAVPLLRSAEAYAGRQELWPLQGRVRRLLAHLGESPRQVQSDAMASLTASERRVAGLAAEGLTNRQIAEQLLVSIKAVEWHLSNIYRKLEIRSRKGLQGAAPV